MLFLYVEFLAIILQKTWRLIPRKVATSVICLFFFLLTFITNILHHNQSIPDKEGRRTSQKLVVNRTGVELTEQELTFRVAGGRGTQDT